MTDRPTPLMPIWFKLIHPEADSCPKKFRYSDIVRFRPLVKKVIPRSSGLTAASPLAQLLLLVPDQESLHTVNNVQTPISTFDFDMLRHSMSILKS
mgnify:CR=1 FL=1